VALGVILAGYIMSALGGSVSLVSTAQGGFSGQTGS
jgi:hypothetical protein